MRLDELIKQSIATLRPTSESAAKEVMMLLMHKLACDELALMTQPERDVDATLIRDEITRLQRHEPIEYILNSVSFYAQTFYIAQGALIPRPETELLIDAIKARLSKDFSGVIADIGTGSGIIAITLAQHFKKARVIAADISEAALAIAQRNIERFNMATRITLCHSDLMQDITERIDVVVSNPPYIARDYPIDKKLHYEPALALFGEARGDEVVLRLIDEANARGVSLLACEYGYDQREAVQRQCQALGLNSVSFYEDLSALDRGFIITFRSGDESE